MSSPALATATRPPEWSAERADLHQRIDQLEEDNRRLEQRIAWFERQLFGEKSERRHLAPPPEQLSLGEGLREVPEAPVPTQLVAAHRRRRATKPVANDAETLFFDPARVPVEVIPVPNPEMEGLAEDAYEVIGEKVAQRPGSYVILKYVRPLIKRTDTQTLACPPCELPRRPGGGQVPLPPAAVPPTSAPARRRHHGQPSMAHPAGARRGAVARPAPRGHARGDSRLPGQGDGRPMRRERIWAAERRRP